MITHVPKLSLFLLAALAAGSLHAQAIRSHGEGGAVVTDRTIDGRRVTRTQAVPAWQPTAWTAPAPADADVCGATAVAWHGQTLPDGEAGTLNPIAFMRPATINAGGRIAFTAKVDDADRNQGTFTADAQGLHIVALGCGADGGYGSTGTCGDPTPIGGTFGGFFRDTFAAPDINDGGDVLFLADVVGGSAPRGLFLYRAAEASIVKVAAVGDPSPLGGSISMLGPGSLNNAGTVAFLAVTHGSDFADILLWRNGKVTKYVAAGDPAPDGGTFTAIATELWGYQDGTSIAGGPAPSLNQKGQIAFRGYVDGGVSAGGLFLSTEGQHEWLVKAGDDAPGGGTYADFQAPILNNAGEIAFFANTSGGPEAIWVAGKPASWRRALAPGDEIDGGTAQVLAYSRNPMRALADNGDLVLWTSRVMQDGNERGTAFIRHADASAQVLAVQGTEAPFGGFWGGSMDAWPAMNNANQVHIGSATPGFALSSDVIVTPCPSVTDRLFEDGFDG